MSRVETVLQQLEDAVVSPKGVAFLLKQQRCQGQRHNSSDCPVAVYVRRRTRTKGVEVNYLRVHTTPARRWGSKKSTVDVPPNISTFIREFDAGKYPELVR